MSKDNLQHILDVKQAARALPIGTKVRVNTRPDQIVEVVGHLPYLCPPLIELSDGTQEFPNELEIVGHTFLDVVQEFVEDMEGVGLEHVRDELDWPNLIVTYLHACEVLDREPQKIDWVFEEGDEDIYYD